MIQRNRGIRAGIFATAVTLVAGCSSFQDPTISVSGIEITESTDEAVAIEFTLDVENPNDEPIKLREFDYGLNVQGAHVYKGRWSAESTVRRNGHGSVTIPAVIRRADMSWQPGDYPEFFEYRLKGSLVYHTPGELAQNAPGFRRPHAHDAFFQPRPRGGG